LVEVLFDVVVENECDVWRDDCWRVFPCNSNSSLIFNLKLKRRTSIRPGLQLERPVIITSGISRPRLVKTFLFNVDQFDFLCSNVLAEL